LLDHSPQAVPVGWGSEGKELPRLRRTAATHGLVLPPQLRDTNPNTRDHIDLCNAVKGQGVKTPCGACHPGHLPAM
jgi:hypothetical protein